MKQERMIEISIGNQKFQLNCQEDDYNTLKAAERYAQQTLQQLRHEFPEVPHERLISMALLNMTFDQLNYRKDTGKDIFIINQSLGNIAVALRNAAEDVAREKTPKL